MIRLNNNISRFTHIAHLADIQIRLTKRHDEYREVFERLFNSISELPDTTAICVVGDIVHNKLDLSPECVQVTKEFLVGLSNLRPTILVAGNHDTNLTNKSRLDSLSPIVEAINHPNLYYLVKSNLYALGDICFNNYSIFEDESTYLKADKIPPIYKNEFRHLICLFHGTVDGAVSEMGFKLVNKNMPLSFFDGHDMVLLGDIHKLQDLQSYTGDKPAVHYPGSLIQQNHGEELNNHGYSLWDLESRSYVHVPIKNDFGYFTVNIDRGEIKTDLTNLPKKVRIRLSCYESLPTETKSVIKELKKLTTFVEPPVYTREEVKVGEKRSTDTLNLVNGDIKNRDHQIKLIREYLKNKLKIEDEGLIQEVIRINDESNANIKNDDIAKNIHWNPVRFEWENLFSFGEENVIDFTKVKDVVGVFAANASGKSAIFSALSWCIFDKCERDFKTNSIINDQKMSCKAKLEVDIGGTHYFIERTGKMDKKGAVKVNIRFWRIVDGKEEDLTGMERSDTNNTIRAYLGSYEDFLLTSLSVQKSGKYDTSFIDLGDSGRKDLLAQFLGLNLFDVLHETANKKLNEIVSTLKIYKNEDFEGDLKSSTDSLSQTELALIDENNKLAELAKKKESIQEYIEQESKGYVKVEGCKFTSLNELNNQINDATVTILNNQRSLGPILEIQKKCNEDMEKFGKRIKELEEKEIVKLSKDFRNLVSDWNETSLELGHKLTEAKSLKEKSKKMEGYEFDSSCKYCVKNADSVAAEAAKAGKELEQYKPIVDALVDKKTDIGKKIDELKWVEKDFEEYNFLLKERIRVQESYLTQEGKAEKITQTIDRTRETLNGLQKQKEIFEKNKVSIQNNSYLDGKISGLKKDIVNVTVLYNNQNKYVQTLIGKISVLKSRSEELKSKIQKVKEIEKQYKAYDLYVQSVSRDGIPYEVIASAVPHIESEVNSILGQMVDFHARFDIDGKNVVPYIVRDERHWLMSLTSGMEYFILSIAIRVALTNLSNLPKMNGIIIDEGFGALDAEHLISVQSLFHYLKSNFEFVIVISHLDTLRDMVDAQIEVKKENGFSKVNFM